MQTNVFSVWVPRMAAFILAGVAAASMVFWALKTVGRPADTSAPAIASGVAAAIDPLAVARALGGGRVPVPAASAGLASRFSLVGVLADSSAGGVAIIAVDGAPPKPFRVGAWLSDGLVLQSVSGRKATLGSERGGPAAVTLELPALKR